MTILFLFLFFFCRGLGGRIYTVYMTYYSGLGPRMRWYQYTRDIWEGGGVDRFTDLKRSDCID